MNDCIAHLDSSCGNCDELQAQVTSLRREVAILRCEASYWESRHKKSKEREAQSKQQIEKLNSQISWLRKTLFGRKSEVSRRSDSADAKAGTGNKSRRKRGQQPGALTHGRSDHSTLPEIVEEHRPQAGQDCCGKCGKAYVFNGIEESTLIEAKILAYRRKIQRQRMVATCECEPQVKHTVVAAVARLFTNTAYGVSVWSLYLHARGEVGIPSRSISRWLDSFGITISAGTLLDRNADIVSLLKPMVEAIKAHMSTANVLHGDETSWRMQARGENGDSQRAWLWVGVSDDAVLIRIDPKRSAVAGMKLFEGVIEQRVLVCDRYSAYGVICKELEAQRALCWAHVRRDFLQAAAGAEDKLPWSIKWLEEIGELYRCNKQRVEQWNENLPLTHQSEQYNRAQRELERCAQRFMELVTQEMPSFPSQSRQHKALASVLRHEPGLSIFLSNPEVPMDNNAAERSIRPAVIARKLSHGSHSEMGAELTAHLYSVCETLKLAKVNILHWLQDYLGECAQNGGQAPPDLSPWLPWQMSSERLCQLRRAAPQSAQGP